MSNLDTLYNEITSQKVSDEYRVKQLHPIPDADTVDRVQFILKQCKGKKVLDIGSSGPLRETLKQHCTLTGLDKKEGADIVCDVEKDKMPDGDYDLIVAGEVIEHLSNPGAFLDKLKKYNCDILITVPNAFSPNSAIVGIENVNLEHVAWYSYHTLKALVERHGYTILEWHWQNGKKYIAEGIIFVVRRI